MVKNPPASTGDVGDMRSIPGLGRNPGEGNDSPFQYSCLENPMDRGAWHRIAKSRTRLKQLNTNTIYTSWAFQVALMVKNLPNNAVDMRCGFDLSVRKIPWRRTQQPTPVFLFGESHGQRSLVGYSSRGHRVRHN